MDETAKVLIGTISGFIIAFFAEPIKLYFQNRFKLNSFRIGLYKEMYHNYLVCKAHYKDLLVRRETLRGKPSEEIQPYLDIVDKGI